MTVLLILCTIQNVIHLVPGLRWAIVEISPALASLILYYYEMQDLTCRSQEEDVIAINEYHNPEYIYYNPEWVMLVR